MSQKVYVDIVGIKMAYEFYYPETKNFFRDRIQSEDASAAEVCIKMDSDYLKKQITRFPDHSAEEVEFNFLVGDTGSRLLNRNACLLHGVGFVYQGKAVILTGPSGVGKSTQYMNWKRNYPEDIQIINGDKVILTKTDKNKLIVHSSPWYGKEGFHNNELSAELGTIVYLRQAKTNRIFTMNADSAIHAIFNQILYIPYSEKEIHAVCSFMGCLLDSAPVLEYFNTGDIHSTNYLRDVLKK